MKNFSYKSLFIIFFLLLIAIVALLKINSVKKISAAWFNDSWNYRKAVSVTNSSGSNLTDFQVSLSIGTSALINAGKMQSDCDDIRITDQNGKLLNFWIEENNPGCNQPTDTKIWVKAPSLPTSGAVVYVYYGNPSATNVQSGNNTFEFFDDFNDGSLNTNKWQTDSGTMTETSSSPGYIYENSTTANNFLVSKNYTFTDGIIETRTSGTRTGGSSDPDNDNAILWRYQDINNFYFVHYDFANPGNTVVCDPACDVVDSRKKQSGYSGGVWIAAPTLDEENNWYNFSVRSIGNTFNIYYSKIGTTVNWTDSSWASGKIGLGSFYFEESARFDYIFVRKPVSTDPTSSLQSEELSPAPIAYWKFDEGVGTTAYDSTSNANNGIFGTGSSAPTWQNEDMCISGKCLFFDGSNDYIDTNIISIGTTVTWSLWFKSTSSGQNGSLISNYNGTALGRPTIELASGVLRVGHFGSGSDFNSIFTPSLNTWYHLTVIHDTSNITVYINGKSYGSVSSTYSTGTFDQDLGRRSAGSYNFKGQIDDVKIYPYSRTATQIKQDYNAGKARASSLKGSSAALGSSNKSGDFLSNGLVGYWKMDEGVGTTTLDSSGNSNTGTFGTGDSAPAWSSGKFGVGTSFDGNDNITVSHNDILISNLNALTISSWVYVNSGYGTLASKYSSSKGYVLYTGTICRLYIDGSSVDADTTIPLSGWHHYVVTYDGTTAKFYLDGQPNGVKSLAKGNIEYNTDSLYIGGTPSEYLRGKIDEVRIYNRALSPNEVQNLYNWAPGPIAYYDFNENKGTAANDKSGNGNNGTLTNSPSWTQGKYGGAISLGSTIAYISVPTLSPAIQSKQLTVSGWFNISSFPTVQRLISAAGSYPMFGFASTTLFVHTTTSSGTDANSPYITLPSTCQSGWHYLTTTWDTSLSSSNVKVFCDAISIGSTTLVNSIGGNFNFSNFWIGHNTQSFVGKVDDLKIYNYARTQKQIVEDMNAGHPAGGSPVGSQLVYYKFDEGYRTSFKNSGFLGSTLNGNFGTSSTTPTWSDGKFNKSLSFGSNSIAQSSGYSSSLEYIDGGGLTLSAWIKSNPAESDAGQIISKPWNGSGMYNYYLRHNADKTITFQIGGTTSYSLSTTTTIPPNEWHYVAASIDSITEGVKIYIDGKLNKTGTNTVTNWSPPDNNNELTIGCIYPYTTTCSAGTNYAFYGLIDEVKIYNYALTDDEIKLDYNRGSALQMGSLSVNTGNTAPPTSGSQEYCIPGDSSICSAPVAQWNFEENIGTTAYDTSGNSNHGVFGTGNSAPTWTTGKQNSGAGLKFDGKQKITVADNTILKPTTAITTEAWFNATNKATTAQRILSKTEGSGYQLSINENSACPASTLCFLININGTYYSATYASSNLSNNIWYHVAGSYDGSTVKLFLNGSNIGTTATISNTITQGAYNLCIGSETDAGNCTSGFFNGKIDNVKIFNYARTPAQIAWDYNRGAPIGHWKLDECQGSTAYDSSGVGNTGAISIGASGTQNSLGTCAVGTSATWTNGATGKINSSLNFDGTDDYIWLGNSTTLSPNNLTISSWFKASSNISGKIIRNRTYGYGLRLSSGNIIANVYESSGNNLLITTTTTYGDNLWHHVIMTYDGTVLKLYVDGKFYSSQNGTGTGVIYYSGNAIGIGRDADSSGDYFTGKIDDVRIYNYALTATQVKTLYNNGTVSFTGN